MSKLNGIAIAIAWPDFMGKQPGSWYDGAMSFLGFNKNFHYKVGHAALILVNTATGSCYHFDCGRYHAPFQHGRIRDASTDENLYIHTKAIISSNRIENVGEILQEVQANKFSFGMGPMHGAYCPVDFGLTWSMAKNMQSRGAIPFGPFVPTGTNCCRFVRSGIIAGMPNLGQKIKLKYFWPLMPTPMGNILCLKHEIIIPEVKGISSPKDLHQRTGHSLNSYSKETIKGTLPAPPRPEILSPKCQWLSGEVAGSWFLLESGNGNNNFTISRFSPDGQEECCGKFSLFHSTQDFDPEKPYTFTHLCHCSMVNVIQGDEKFTFYKTS
ncbi:DUF6695 family protein [Rhodonellum sp.]|uniref:DUF6695 family protein n=1 Tax=Rhodonellum sp. TaxID=2231180 RepID=UPI00271776FE|nr:DUF6695 family protein [Rhodonellum sp.]MDO9554260.1 hypothetical protein [Rhodonellum sp.]